MWKPIKVSNRSKNFAKLRAFIVLSFALVSLPQLCAATIWQAAEAKPVVPAFRLPDTPFLPPYTGRIVSGITSTIPQNDGGIAYIITFETAEQPEQVMNWYKTAFNLYRWKIDDQETAQYRISAQHGQNVATNVSLKSPKKLGASAQVQLYYRYQLQKGE